MSITIDNKSDFKKVKNFININKCKPGLSNICNYLKKGKMSHE